MKVTKKKICLITPGHIASNPRLVKEAQFLTKNGFDVQLIFTQYVDYIINFDSVIFKNNPTWTCQILNRTTKNIKTRFQNFTTALLHKTCAMLLLRGIKSEFIFAHAINRYFSWQLKQAVLAKAHLYIAHNLAALPVAVLAAKVNKTKCGFDAEDFHRNETTDDPKDQDVLLKTFIEENYIPQTSYLTTGSLPITKLYLKLFPAKKIITISNAFPIERDLKQPVLKMNEPLKLFWFSQTIGLNRGLQDIISALKILENEYLELHLLGFLADKTSISLDKIISGLHFKKQLNIFFHKPIQAEQIPTFAAQFDVGLALETGFCLNNDAALSNKIFTYLQAGLAVVASNTIAQKEFIYQNQDLGFCYEKGNAVQLASVLKRFIDEPNLLLATKQASYQAARNQLNWETESLKFLKVVEETLAD